MAKTGGAILGDIAATGFEGGYGSDPGTAIETLKGKLKAAGDLYKDKVGLGGSVASLGQAGMEAAGTLMGVSPNQQLALARGAVFNPNMELLFSGPSLRSFNFNFRLFRLKYKSK